LKGWGCCKKKVCDFDEFLAIPGCAFGRHKPAEEKAPVKPKQTIDQNLTVETIGDKEHFVDSQAKSKLSASKTTIKTENLNKNDRPEFPDPEDAVIELDTPCKHHGCNATYKDNSSRSEVCVYHPGNPEFHEGSKGWDCCKSRMLEYAEFLKIVGCKEGKHKFIPDSKVTVKYNYYQGGNVVYLTFYSKGVNKERSTFSFQSNLIHANLTLSNGDVYDDDIFLAREIKPEECTFEIGAFKVEVKLKKSVAEEWNLFRLDHF